MTPAPVHDVRRREECGVNRSGDVAMSVFAGGSVSGEIRCEPTVRCIRELMPKD
jgi:hypothetical protein